MRETEKQPTEIELNRLVLDYRRKVNNTPLEQIQWRRDNTPLEQIQEDLMTLLDGQVDDETITAACQIVIHHFKNFDNQEQQSLTDNQPEINQNDDIKLPK